jgi:hypothetical protein
MSSSELRVTPAAFSATGGPPRAAARGIRARVLDELRSRYMLRTCDAVLTAALPGHLAGEGGDRSRSNYEHIRAAIGAASRLSPAAIQRLRGALMTSLFLPFLDGEAELLGFGSAATVFLLRPAESGTGAPALVLKVFRKTLGRRVDHAVELVSGIRARHDAVAADYHDCSLVVPAHFVVLHGPVLGRAAGACIQPYVEGEKRDFVALLGDERLPGLIRDSAPLRSQFRTFAERTLGLAAREHRCIDLVGGGNLFLVEGRGAPRLQLIDSGLHDFRLLQHKSPWLLGRARERLTQLGRLYEQVFGETAGDTIPHSRCP